MGVVSHHAVGVYQAGEGVCTLRERLHKADGSRRGCLYFWGRGNASWQATSRVYWNGLQRDLAEAGIPVLSGDYGSPTHWGAPVTVTRAEQLRSYGVTQLGIKSDKVLVLAISMGALAALNWASANPSKVAAVALITPVLDLAWAHDTYGGGSEAAQIDTAFGGNAAYLAAVGTSNPMTRAASFQGVPVKLWYSTDDPSVPTAHVASFATAAGAPTASLGAVGHSAGSLTAEALTSFFAPYL
jgi:pimeloyl-ACP methyl ester carboxylesterase